ncbi:MAG: hypothetical protein N4A53_08045 [Pelagimonas sp.]|jgi:hypothetical protein|nr:hypothetical protein [Pelagimonas sp.]
MRSDLLPQTALSDFLLVHREGSLRQQDVSALALQLSMRGAERSFPSIEALRVDEGLAYDGENPVAPGARIWAGATPYRIAPEGATDAHITTQGGVAAYVNLNHYELSAEAFGVRFTGDEADATENATRLQGALDWLYAEGQGGRITLASEGHVTGTAPIAGRSGGVEFDGRGTLYENVLTEDDAQGALSRSALVLGSWATQDDNDYAWRRMGTATSGADWIEAADGDASWTAVGREILFLRATADNLPTSSFGDGVDGQGGGTGDYDRLQARIVTRIDGGRIYLDLPVHEAIAAGSGTLADVNDPALGCWAVDASFASVTAQRSGGLIARGARHVLSDFHLHDLRIKARSGVPFQRSAMHRCLIERVTVEPSSDSYAKYGFGANLLSWTRVRDWTAPFWTRALEVAAGSDHSELSGMRIYRHVPEGVTLPAQEPLIRFDGENSRFIIVRDSVFLLGDVADGTALLKFAGGSDCAFLNNEITATGLGNAVVFDEQGARHLVAGNLFRGSAEFGFDVKGIENVLRNNRLHMVCSEKAVRLHPEADGCIVDLNDLGDGVLRIDGDPAPGLRPSIVTGNRRLRRFENTGRAIVTNNMMDSWQSVLAEVLAWDETALTPASGVAETEIHDELVIPAGVLAKGMILEFDFEGAKTGVAGEVTLELIMAADTNQDGADDDVTDDRSVSLRWTFGNAVETTFKGVVSFRVANFSAVEFRAEARAGVALYSNANTKTGMDFANRPVRFEWRASSSAGDVLSMDRIRLNARMPGMTSAESQSW